MAVPPSERRATYRLALIRRRSCALTTRERMDGQICKSPVKRAGLVYLAGPGSDRLDSLDHGSRGRPFALTTSHRALNAAMASSRVAAFPRSAGACGQRQVIDHTHGSSAPPV